jgi:iron complex outermembrane receptor protein
MERLLSAAGAAALACTTALCGPVLAAEQTGPTGTLEEIVVTAEKRASTVQEVPISISALSGDELAQKNVVTLEDLAGAVPGVSMRTAGPGQTEYEMRGLTSAGGSTATVGFYIDEVPLSASAVALNGRTVIDPDLFDLNHVEVLRGPQGTLYGAGSMGGTIKLVTNQPKLGAFEGASDVNVSDTTHGSVNGGASLMLNLPIGDKVALRLVGTDKYISGFIDRIVDKTATYPYPTGLYGTPGTPAACTFYYCTRGDVVHAPVDHVVKNSNLERFGSGRAMLLVKPNDQLSVTTTLMYQRIAADGYNNYQDTSGWGAIYQPYDTQEPYYDYFKMASLDVVYDFGPATLTFAPAYWKRHVFQSTDSTEALQNIQNTVTFIQNLYQDTDETTQVSAELRLASNGKDRLQWQGGLYAADLHSGYVTYNQEPGFATAQTCGFSAANPVAGHCDPTTQFNINSTFRYPDASLPPYPNPVAANPLGQVFNDNNPNVMKQSAIFGEVSYKLTDDLKLTAGIRYFKFTISNDANQRGVGTASLNQDPTILHTSEDGSAVLPKLNLSYTPTPDLTLYSTISKGSRPGGVNLPIPIPSIQQLQLNPSGYNCGYPLANQLDPTLPIPPGAYVTKQPQYGPDNVLSFEIGEKAKLFDRRFTVDADVYYIKWKDIQQIVSLSCGYPADINAGEARAYGPEVELSARVTDGLTLNLSGAYTSAVINKPNAQAAGAGFYPGIKIINVPKYTAVASLDYQWAATDKLHGLFHISSSMVGPIEDQAYYRQTLPSHNLVDARAGVSHGAWAAYVVGTNLTNVHAQLTIDNTVFAWQQPTIQRVSTNQPRTIGIDAQYRF